MKIQHKSSLLMFGIGVAFLITVSTIYYFHQRRSAVIHAQRSSHEQVKELAYHVEEHMKKDAHLTSTLASAPIIAESLVVSNATFSRLSEKERELEITRLNRKWMGIRDVNDPFIQSFMTNPIASYLMKQQEMFPDFFGEIFLTNRYGVILATTKKLTTLAHAHKHWWIGAYYKGKGRCFFDDRGFDESVKGYVLGIVVPVMKEDEVIGIMKCNIKILGSYSHAFDESTEKKPGTFSLVRSKGLIVFEKDIEPLSRTTPQPVIEEMNNWHSNSLVMPLDGTKQIISYAPIAISKGSDQYGFGGSYKSVDHIKGNTGEGWFVIFSRDLQETLADSERFTRGILLAGMVLILLMALSALLFGRKIANPIIELAELTKKVGKGDFKTEIEYTSKDELGVLVLSFNAMIRNLRETTTSRDKLQEEINQRRKAEKESERLGIQLQQAKKMEAIGTMAGGIVHNFNNLLSVILGYIEMAQEKMEQGNPTQPYLKQIFNAANQARELIGQIVAFSHQASFTSETIQPGVFLREYLTSIRNEAPANITVDHSISPDIAPVCLEPGQMKLIADHLCINALWAMRQSGGVLGLRLEPVELEQNDTRVAAGVAPGRFIQFNVSDTGQGIAPTTMERVFDPFFTTKDVGEGNGIGLSVI
ncbi:MAG: HAMP domain-containing protein, partial [Desulfobulbaceae bacterium]|nr:HAMP domain-containing protein [Desulfobulbaceae bacterium]